MDVTGQRIQGLQGSGSFPGTTLTEEGSGGEVQVGSRVRVRDVLGEQEYTIVTRAQADPAQGRISTESPVGRALLGRRRGDHLHVQTPGGIRALTVLGVAAPHDHSSEE